jgi:amidase
LSGNPSVSVPTGFASDGLHISISFLGEAFSEPTLLKLAYSYEQATKHRKPPEFIEYMDRQQMAIGHLLFI